MLWESIAYYREITIVDNQSKSWKSNVCEKLDGKEQIQIPSK